jgi:hypothetical protein
MLSWGNNDDIHHIDLDGNVVDVSKDVTNNGNSSYRVFVHARRSRWWALHASPTTAPLCAHLLAPTVLKNALHCSAVTGLRETAPVLCRAALATALSTVPPFPPCLHSARRHLHRARAQQPFFLPLHHASRCNTPGS